MLELGNATPFSVGAFPFSDLRGVDHLCVVSKATWRITANGEVALHEEQAPILLADLRHDDAPTASVLQEADTTWPKPATDVALQGFAYPVRKGDAAVDIALRVSGGAVRATKVVRVFGDRRWKFGLAGWTISSPEPFERIPLVWERAFGGTDSSDPDPRKHARDERNPIGTGFAVAGTTEHLATLALPNIEDPTRLIGNWKDKPAPAGFGLLDRSWAPRRQLAGTYDRRWQEARAPLLPMDFDPRYFNAATSELTFAPHLEGGEQVVIVGANRRGHLGFLIPRRRIGVSAWMKGQLVRATSRLDTVHIDAESETVLTIWRAALPCPRALLHIRKVFVKEVA